MRLTGLSASNVHARRWERTARHRPPDEPTSLTRLVIPSALYHQMIDELRRALPYEGCGLIATHGTRARKLFPGTNTEQSETRYNMDPKEVIDALSEIRERGWTLGAIYHSHPQSEAMPSQTDLDLAYYPEALMVIVSFKSRTPVVRAFRVDGRVRRAPIIVV